MITLIIIIMVEVVVATAVEVWLELRKNNQTQTFRMVNRRTETRQGGAIDSRFAKSYGYHIDRASPTKTRAGVRARAIYIAPKMVLPHGDTQVIDLTALRRSQR